MATWSGIRNKLEQDYLAKSLQGRVTYFATSYTNAHNQIGRAAIRIGGKEIFKGDYYHKEWLHWECYQKLEREENEDRIDNWMKAWDEAVIRGGFDNQSFYQAFAEFDNQSIEASLASGNLLVRIFAVLDRRLGKRRLERLSKAWGSEPEYLKFFLHLRMEAEGVRML